MRRDWKQEARIAIDELKGVNHGDREREMQSIARSLSGHNDTSALRRSIFAFEFLMHMKGARPAAYESLKEAPLSVVSAIARWHAFDPPKALAVADDWAKGIGTFKSITADMKAARPKGFAGKTGSVFEKAYLAAAEPLVAEAVWSLSQVALLSPQTQVKDPSTGQAIDFLFDAKSPEAGKPRQVVVLVVGPYNNRKIYATRCAEWVMKAWGLALLYDRVVLALPDGTSLDEYSRRNANVARKAKERFAGSQVSTLLPRVDVVHIEVDPLEPADHEALDKLII
jgi:hypothetical protein